MSSVGKIAVAQDLVGICDTDASAPCSTRKVVEPPSLDGLLAKALDLEAQTAFGRDLPGLWVQFVRGQLRAWRAADTFDRHYLLARAARGPTAALSEAAASMVVSILRGEAGKAVALDLGIAPSTVARHRSQAFAAFDVRERAPPLPLVLAAQTWAGVASVPTARIVAFDHADATYVAASVPHPVTSHLHALTPAERQIAASLMKGETRREIALRRGSSQHTVAGQIHALYAALRVTGRFALIRRAAEERCFF